MTETKKELKKGEMPKAKPIENFSWIIPRCCEELWDNCPHVLKKQKKRKSNVGL